MPPPSLLDERIKEKANFQSRPSCSHHVPIMLLKKTFRVLLDRVVATGAP